MADDPVSALISDLDPASLDARYLSHATFTLRGVSHRVDGVKLRRLLEHSSEYNDIEDCQIFLKIGTILKDVQDEVDYIKAKVLDRLRGL